MNAPPSEYHAPGEAVWIVYDLADPSQWSMAGQCVRCWGRERTTIHNLDSDHVLVVFKPGGARDLEEAS